MLVLFLIAFPKGGFKVGNVPITWGYLLLAFTFLLIVAKIIITNQFSITVNRLLAFAVSIPFQLYCIMVFAVNGVASTGFYISLLTSFIFLPFFFLIITGYYIDRIDLHYTFKQIKRAIFFIAVYGIALFIYKVVTKKFLEIPYLTVNADDFGQLENKFINRGSLFKLISTYNNGNIFGVSVLMFLPLYNQLEKSSLKKLAVYLSLVLTLSRTVWIGIMLFQVFKIFNKKAGIKNIIFVIISFVVIGISIGYMLSFMNYDLTFLFDKNLGGRAKQLEKLKEIEFITSKKFSLIAEIIYISVLDGFGILGLIFFLLSMLAPLIIYILGITRYKKSRFKTALFQGLLLYLILSFSDGAILYIPVMAFYWLITSFLLSKNTFFGIDIQRSSVKKFTPINDVVENQYELHKSSA